MDDIIIKSNHLKVNKADGKADFSGDVIVWFDGAVLKTQRIILIINDSGTKRELEKIVFPSKLSAMNESENETIIADSAEYLADKNLLIFKGNIYMQKDERLVKCDELIYHVQIKAIHTHKSKNNKITDQN